MKRISIALLTLTAAFASVSCQKVAELQVKTTGQMTITAIAEQVGAGTKAEMAYGYEVLWNENDEILVKDASNSAIFKLTAGAGTTKGTFTGATVTGDVEAYYPASLIKKEKLVWPALQQNNQVAPLYCKQNISSTTEEFSFKSLGAVMQIVLTTPVEDITLKSIKVEDAAKTMSGEFSVTEDQATITASNGAGITLDLGEGEAIGLAAKYFNIAIPAGKYEDITLTFTTTDGKECVLNSKTLPEVKRNVVGRLTLVAKEFKPVVTDADLVVYGKIFRSETDRDGEFLHARAFAVKDGKFVYVGNEDGAASFIEEGKTTVIDHREKGIIIPGCYEGHAHYMMANGMNLMGGPMLKQECTPDEFKAEIKKAYDQAKAAGKSSIYGFGWSYQNFIDNMPTRTELDAICPDIALFVSDAEGHKGLANTKCLQNAGIMDKNGDVLIVKIRGGEICMDENGKPDGLLKEQAGTYVRKHGINFNEIFPVPLGEQAVAKSQEQLLANGYVSYMYGHKNEMYNIEI